VKAYIDGGLAAVEAKYPGAGAWIENALLNSGCAQKVALAAEPVALTATPAQLAAIRLAYAQQQQVGVLSRVGLTPQVFTAVRSTTGTLAPPLPPAPGEGVPGVPQPTAKGGNALAIAAAAGLALLLLRR